MAGLPTKREHTTIFVLLAISVLSQVASAESGPIFADSGACTLMSADNSTVTVNVPEIDFASTFCVTDGKIASVSASATISPCLSDEQSDSAQEGGSSALSLKSRNWLFVIGIDKYSEWPQLQNSVRDAKAVRDILLKRYMFERQYVIELYDEQATRENIIKRFEELSHKVEPTDNILIYYAGHGEYDQTFKRGCWIPVDASTHTTAQHIPGTDLQAFLGAIRSRGILVISDACFSGTLFPGGAKSFTPGKMHRRLQGVAKLKARQALMSGGDEPVMDESVFIDQHSIFAHYLIDRLRKNTDKYLSASSLYEQIKESVSNKSFQTPECKAIQNAGDEGGEFMFVRE